MKSLLLKIRPALTAAACLSILVGLLAGCMSKEEREQAYLEKAEAFFEEGDLVKTKLEARNVLQINPQNGPVRFLLYKVNLEDDNPKGAIKNLNAAVDNAPWLLEAQVARGELMLAMRNTEAAMEHVDSALEIDPQSAGAYSLLAAIRLREKDEEGALEMVRQALALDPARVSALDLLVRLQGEDTAPALAAIERALEVDPQEPDLTLLKAKVLNSQGDVDAVVALYESLLQAHPDELDYYQRLVNYLIFHDRLDESERLLRDMVASLPDNLEIKLWLAEFLANFRNDHELARQTIEQYIAEQPDVYEFRFALSKIYFALQERARGIAVLEEIIALDPEGPDGLEARNQLAFFELLTGSPDKARSLLQEVLAIEPVNTTALTAMARFKLEQGEVLEAISDLRRVVRDNPEAVQPRVILADAYAMNDAMGLALDSYRTVLEMPGGGKKDVALKLARLLIEDGQFEEADRLLETRLGKQQTDLDVARLLVESYGRQGNWKAADQLAAGLKKEEAGEALGTYMEGRILLAQGEREKALERFRQTLQIDPQSAEALSSLTDTLLRLERPADAVAYLEAHVASHADQAFPWTQLAVLHVQSGNRDRAIDAFNRSLELEPVAPSVYVALANVYRGKGDIDSVAKTYERGLQYSPDSVELLLLRAELDESRQNYDRAARRYEKVLELAAGNRVATNNLAMLLVNHLPTKENLARAREITRSFENDTVPTLLDTRGWVLYRSGDYSAALQILTRAVRSDEVSPEYHYHLGMTYYRMGDKHAAIRELSEAVSSDADFVGRAEAQSVLSQLQ